MIKVLFNNDGSIDGIDLPQYITQGSSGEIDALLLEVAVKDLDLISGDYTVQAQFTLPNGTNNALTFDKDIEEFTLLGKVHPNGKGVYLTEAQTYYSGILLVSLKIVDASLNTLYTYKCKLTINPTTYQPDSEDTMISNAQYTNIGLSLTNLKNQISQINGQLRVFDTLSDAEKNIRDLAIGQIIFINETNELYICQENDDDEKILVLISRNKIISISCSDATNPPAGGTIVDTSISYYLNNNLVEALCFYDSNGNSNFYVFENNNGTITTFTKLNVTTNQVTKDIRQVTNSNGYYNRSGAYFLRYEKAMIYKHILAIPVTLTTTSITPTTYTGTCYATLYNNSSTQITTKALLLNALSLNETLPAYGSVLTTSFIGIYKSSSSSFSFQYNLASGIITYTEGATITDTVSAIKLSLSYS